MNKSTAVLIGIEGEFPRRAVFFIGWSTLRSGGGNGYLVERRRSYDRTSIFKH